MIRYYFEMFFFLLCHINYFNFIFDLFLLLLILTDTNLSIMKFNLYKVEDVFFPNAQIAAAYIHLHNFNQLETIFFLFKRMFNNT